MSSTCAALIPKGDCGLILVGTRRGQQADIKEEKQKKKIASLLLVLLLVIAIAAPAMALGSNMEYISCDARVIPADGKTYTISTRTGASRTNVTGMMTCDMNANLSISLVVEIATVGGTYLRNRTFSNIESGKSVSVSGSESVPEMFSSVDASYFVNGKLGLEYSIS